MTGTLRVLSEDELGCIAGGSMNGAGDPNWIAPQSSFHLQGIPVVPGSSFGGVGGLSTSTFGSYAAHQAAMEVAAEMLQDRPAAVSTQQPVTVSGVEQTGQDVWRYDYSDGSYVHGYDYDGNGTNDLNIWSDGEITTADAFANMQAFTSVTYSAGVVTGATSMNADGELFQTVGVGIGTPGVGLEVGLVANGDLSGTSVNISDGLTVSFQNSGEIGQIGVSTSPGVSLSYTVNVTQAVNDASAAVNNATNVYINGVNATYVAPNMPGYQQPYLHQNVTDDMSLYEQWLATIYNGTVER